MAWGGGGDGNKERRRRRIYVLIRGGVIMIMKGQRRDRPGFRVPQLHRSLSTQLLDTLFSAGRGVQILPAKDLQSAFQAVCIPKRLFQALPKRLRPSFLGWTRRKNPSPPISQISSVSDFLGKFRLRDTSVPSSCHSGLPF